MGRILRIAYQILRIFDFDFDHFVRIFIRQKSNGGADRRIDCDKVKRAVKEFRCCEFIESIKKKKNENFQSVVTQSGESLQWYF